MAFLWDSIFDSTNGSTTFDKWYEVDNIDAAGHSNTHSRTSTLGQGPPSGASPGPPPSGPTLGISLNRPPAEAMKRLQSIHEPCNEDSAMDDESDVMQTPLLPYSVTAVVW